MSSLIQMVWFSFPLFLIQLFIEKRNDSLYRFYIILSFILLGDKSQACNNGGDNKSYINCDTLINKWKEKDLF